VNLYKAALVINRENPITEKLMHAINAIRKHMSDIFNSTRGSKVDDSLTSILKQSFLSLMMSLQLGDKQRGQPTNVTMETSLPEKYTVKAASLYQRDNTERRDSNHFCYLRPYNVDILFEQEKLF
jgi:hypothetical protein